MTLRALVDSDLLHILGKTLHMAWKGCFGNCIETFIKCVEI